MKLSKGLFILLIVIFAISCGNEESNEDNAEVIASSENLNNTIDSLQTALNNLKANEEELNVNYQELEKQIKEKTAEPVVKTVYKTKVEYKADEKSIAELETEKKKVKQQLLEIKKLKGEISKKEQNLLDVKEQLTLSETENENLYSANDVNSMVSKIIKTQLTVSDIDIELYTRKIEDKSKKYLFVEIIETSFTINENKFTPKGEKVVYICMYDSKKNILSHEESKTFKTFDGLEKKFSAKSEFTYDEEKLRMSILWEKEDIKLEPGTYTTEFYIDNALAGVGEFEVQ